MAFRRKKFTKRNYKKKINVKKVVAKEKTKQLAKFVRNVIQRTEEKKTIRYTKIENLAAYTNATNRPKSIIAITPYDTVGVSITQGTSQSGRIGNKIKLTKVIFSGLITPNPYGANNSAPRPQEIRMWFFSDKYDNDSVPNNITDFFQSGGTSIAPTGTVLDLMYTVNSDAYIYRGHRTFKVGYASYQGTGINAAGQAFANNDYKFNQRFQIDCTKMCPKTITFNDNNGVPTSTAVWCYIECVNADGTSQATDQTPCRIDFGVEYTYTDA